jgi:hypothetical protein
MYCIIRKRTNARQSQLGRWHLSYNIEAEIRSNLVPTLYHIILLSADLCKLSPSYILYNSRLAIRWILQFAVHFHSGSTGIAVSGSEAISDPSFKGLCESFL